MKSKINILLFILMISSSFIVNAQEESFEKTIMLTAAKEAVKNDNSLVTNKISQNNNLIQVQQIGSYNYSDVSVRSNNASIDINQLGNNNYTNVYKNSYDLNENIYQIGNNNFISDFSMYSADPINTSFNQQGNNLTIISEGSNSISKNMQINQSGNSGTVYIINR